MGLKCLDWGNLYNMGKYLSHSSKLNVIEPSLLPSLLQTKVTEIYFLLMGLSE